MFEKITMYVDGELVWGVAPDDAPDAVTTETFYGDADVNGKIELADAVLIAKSMGSVSGNLLTVQGRRNADVKLDDTIDEKDLVLMLRFFANLIPQTDLGAA